jgi:hypothetical protein
MATNRKMVSDIRASHRLLSGDSVLNDRSILSELNNVAKVLIRRELNLRKLVATDSIYTPIPCLELIEVPLSECCDYVDECSIARTKLQLPRIEESNYLNAIQAVFSINQKKKLKEITPSRYINILNLPVKRNEVYYWLQNNYLYVTDPSVEMIKLIAWFAEEVPVEILYPIGCDSCKCKTVVNKELCKNPLDNEFKAPGYLHQNIIEMTSKYLLSTYFNLSQDTSDNNQDNQARNTQQQTKD